MVEQRPRIAWWVKNNRLLVGLVQTRLAALAGVSPGYIGDIERGEKPLTDVVRAALYGEAERRGITLTPEPDDPGRMNAAGSRPPKRRPTLPIVAPTLPIGEQAKRRRISGN